MPDATYTADGALGVRADVVVAVITAGDAGFLWERPALAAAKYAEMATDPFAFFRGALALFLHDWNDSVEGLQATRFPASDARPFGLGDAHLENFGTMRTRTGVFRLEPNDFDAADRLPYLWDVRRFGVGMCLAARLANDADPVARAISSAADHSVVRKAMTAYADAIRALAAGTPALVVEDGGGNPILEDLFSRTQADGRARLEFDQLTVVKEGTRRLVRGMPNLMDPGLVTRDLPARARLEIPRTVARYLPSLHLPPTVREVVPLDAVQMLGRGIGSLPRVRAVTLIRGPTTDPADDLILEIKELPPEGSLPIPSRFEFPDARARIAAALTAGWSQPDADPLWGTGLWLGVPVQVRTLAMGFKTLRVARLDGSRGTPQAIAGLGATLAGLIARMHAAPVGGVSLAVAIAGDLEADATGFIEEQTEVSIAYCDRVLSDWDLFKQALALLGSTLGASGDPAHASSDEWRVLFDPDSDPRSAAVDPVTGPVTLNEVAAAAPDFVEILNVSNAVQGLGSYSVADSANDGGPRFEQAVRFAPDTVLRPKERIVVVGGYPSPSSGARSACLPGVATCYETAWDISSARGEAVYLIGPDDVIADQISYPVDLAADKSQSWSRLPDGFGPFAVGRASPGAVNVPP